MGAIATGVVEGTLSAATYAATEKLAYGRDHTWEDTLKVGLQSGIIAGETKEIMQALGLCNCFIAGTLVATETGYYYLQTRYYNPEWGRFINADGYINANGDILGYNMFAYCSNNPVMYVDPKGTCALIAVVLVAVVIVVVTTMPSKDEHYSRNDNNKTPDEEDIKSIVNGENLDWVSVDEKYNAYHKFTNGSQGDEAKYNKNLLLYF